MARCKIFPHFTMKVFRDLERQSRPELHPQIRLERCFTLFYVCSGDFGLRFLPQKWGIKKGFVNIFLSTEPK